MRSVEELKTKIKKLQTEKTQLKDELNRLKQQIAACSSNSKQQKDGVYSIEEFAAIK